MEVDTSSITHEENVTEKFQNKLSFVKKFPVDVPVFITYSYPNHGDVDMLIIPEYYINDEFRCTILAVDAPLIPDKLTPTKEARETVGIHVEHIVAWRSWKREEAFLNFGNGYITERYLNMILN